MQPNDSTTAQDDITTRGVGDGTPNWDRTRGANDGTLDRKRTRGVDDHRSDGDGKEAKDDRRSHEKSTNEVAAGSIALNGGGFFNLITPRAADINFAQVAASLSKLCRFTGHTSHFYSVAQHTTLVTDNVSDEAKPFALVHDAHEAFIGDWSTPLKTAWMTLAPQAGERILAMEKQVERVVHEAAGLAWPVPDAIKIEIRMADTRALLTERNSLGLQFGAPWPMDRDHKPFDIKGTFTAWTPVTAQMALLDMFRDAGFIGENAPTSDEVCIAAFPRT